VALSEQLRARMCAAATSLGVALGYVGAGTVEFIFDDVSKEFFFLEVCLLLLLLLCCLFVGCCCCCCVVCLLVVVVVVVAVVLVMNSDCLG
jgi:hypothetical protein